MQSHGFYGENRVEKIRKRFIEVFEYSDTDDDV